MSVWPHRGNGGCPARRHALRLGAGLLGVLALAGTAAAQGYAAGERAFEQGEGERARAICRPLARAGSARAQHALGVLFDRGKGDVAADPTAAARWYRRAAAQGHRDAQTNLARLQAQGRGVTEDPERAAKLWRRAARHGHAVAQYNLALAYRQGRGVPTDPPRAVRWLRRAAHQGLVAAQRRIAAWYRQGRGVARDPARALAWLERAGEAGDRRAAGEARRLRKRGVAPAAIPDPPGDIREARRTPRRYALWLGSAPSRRDARARWRALRRRLGDALADLRLRVHTPAGAADRDPGVSRLLGGRFPNADAAHAACRRLRSRDRALFCQVVPWSP